MILATAWDRSMVCAAGWDRSMVCEHRPWIDPRQQHWLLAVDRATTVQIAVQNQNFGFRIFGSNSSLFWLQAVLPGMDLRPVLLAGIDPCSVLLAGIDPGSVVTDP